MSKHLPVSHELRDWIHCRWEQRAPLMNLRDLRRRTPEQRRPWNLDQSIESALAESTHAISLER